MTKNSATDWTDTYFDQDYLYREGLGIPLGRTQKEVDLCIRVADIQKDHHILDLGCGHGRHVMEMARRGFKHVYGLDFSQVALEYGQKNAAQEQLQINWIQGDFRQLDQMPDLHGKFDVVWSLYNSIFYWEDEVHIEILKSIAKLLKPEGKLIIEIPNREAMIIDEYISNSNFLSFAREAKRILSHIKYRIRHRIFFKVLDGGSSFAKRHFDLASGIMTSSKQYHSKKYGDVVKPLRFRLYALSELKFLLEQAGFKVLSSQESITGYPASLRSGNITILVNKK
jgi:2-polyprenyl-3-methyl-5-hydroxy-6-metoxy-1,4-benzoquinol methylase